jgi:hypothetical protein
MFKRLLVLLAVMVVVQTQDCNGKVDPATGYYPGQLNGVTGQFMVTRTPLPTMPLNWHSHLTAVPYVPDRGPNYDPNVSR